ncbi:MAG: hypothetical protein ABI675_15165 [Chitinophagaceae bacterium]
MKEKAIVSTATLLASLLAYWYAKESDKDPVPYVMFGGFLGSIVGETIVGHGKGDKNSS